jgi:uncharacterized protein
MFKQIILASACLFFAGKMAAQSIATFQSIKPNAPTEKFQFPELTHTFQFLLESGEQLSTGGSMPSRHDFTGFVPSGGQSTAGFVAINAEVNPSGDVTILDVHFNKSQQKWIIDASEKVDFDVVEGTRNNCSGTVTPWGSVISCEENKTASQTNAAGFNRFGFCIEIDPVTKTIRNYEGGLPSADKIWKMGFCNHENAVVRPDEHRVLYTGMDNPRGFLFKYVTKIAGDLGDGRLFVFQKTVGSEGHWLLLKNSFPSDVNRTIEQCERLNATTFNGIEDIEIGPDGAVYFAVKGEGKVYRFRDDSPLCAGNQWKTSHFETFLGGKSYEIETAKGKIKTPWGLGNDNLAFDPEGNLWVLQDGTYMNMWVVAPEHTQENSKISLFGIAPAGAEPTGLTFTPDGKYGFMSFQHPNSGNNAAQKDAFGQPHRFNKDVAIVFSRKEYLGNAGISPTEILFSALSEWSGEIIGQEIELSWITDFEHRLNHFIVERMTPTQKWETIGTIAGHGTTESESWYQFSDKNPWLGTNMYRLREVDFDGNIRLSDVIQVGFFPKNAVNGGKIWPNPASRTLNIQLTDATNEPIEVLVLNTLGVRKIAQKMENVENGRCTINVERLHSGAHFLQIRQGERVLMTGRFSVAR